MMINKAQLKKVLHSAAHREDIIIFIILHYFRDMNLHVPLTRKNICDYTEISYVCCVSSVARLIKLKVVSDDLIIIKTREDDEYISIPLDMSQIKHLRNNLIQFLHLKWFFQFLLDGNCHIQDLTIQKSTIKCLITLAKMGLINVKITPNFEFIPGIDHKGYIAKYTKKEQS